MKKTNQVKLDVFKQQLDSLWEKEDLSTALTRTENIQARSEVFQGTVNGGKGQQKGQRKKYRCICQKEIYYYAQNFSYGLVSTDKIRTNVT